MRKCLYCILILIACVFYACKGDAYNAGQGVLDAEDEIVLRYGVFGIGSSLTMSPGVISMPDSFLVGELETRFGSLRAGVLTQLSCPESFRYPENAVIDSVCMMFSYRSWIGDDASPLAINVYEMDLATLAYSPSSPYLTQLKVSDYCSLSPETAILSRERIVVAGKPTDSLYLNSAGIYIPALRVRLSDEFAERFTSMREFKSQEEFNDFFKGLYVVSDYGSATVLNLRSISLGVYFHYDYTRPGVTVKDTTITESDVKGFYASAEVRQVNVFEYLNDKGNWLEDMSNKDTSYVIAPAGIYTTLKLPMAEIADSIKANLGGRRPYVNKAEIRVQVLDGDQNTTDKWLAPSTYMMLMKENDSTTVETFFAARELPNDTAAILSTLSSELDSLGNVKSYYSFDIATLLTKQLRAETNPDTLRMTIVPVDVAITATSSTTTSITAVHQSQKPSATMIRSAQNSVNPMSLEVVYSGFSYTRQ